MRVPLDDEYFLDGDTDSVNLVRIVTVGANANARGRKPSAENIGKKREDVVGYYARVEHALDAYLKAKTQGANVVTVGQLIAVIREVEAHICKVVEQWGMNRKALKG